MITHFMLPIVAQVYLENVEKLTSSVLEQYVIKSPMGAYIDLNIVQKNEILNLKSFLLENRQIFMSGISPYELYSPFAYYYPEEIKND